MIQDARIHADFILKFKAPPLPKVLISVKDGRNHKIIHVIKDVTPDTVATAGGPPANYTVDLKTLPTLHGRKLRKNKAYSFDITPLSDVDATIGPKVEADSTAVDPEPSIWNWLKWVVIALVVIAIGVAIFLKWPATLDDGRSGVENIRKEMEKEVEGLRDDLKQAKEEIAEFKNKLNVPAPAPPVSTPAVAATPANPSPSQIISGTNSVPAGIAVPRSETVGSNGATVTAINSIVNGPMIAVSSPIPKSERKVEGFPNKDPKQTFDPAKMQPKGCTSFKVEVLLHPGDDVAFVQEKGWRIAYDGDFYKVLSAFNVRDRNGIPMWENAHRVDTRKTSVEAARLYNSGELSRKTILSYEFVGDEHEYH